MFLNRHRHQSKSNCRVKKNRVFVSVFTNGKISLQRRKAKLLLSAMVSDGKEVALELSDYCVLKVVQGDITNWSVDGSSDAIVLVQVGDILVRGDDEIAILSLLRSLDDQAKSNGGAVFQVNGNHETMNVEGDFRYVDARAFDECTDFLDYLHLQDFLLK